MSNKLTRRAFVTTCGLGLASVLAPTAALADDELVDEAALEGDALDDTYTPEPVENLANNEYSTGMPWDASAPNEEGEVTFLPEEALTEEDLGEGVELLATSASTSVVELGGMTRYETAAQEALRAYSRSSNVLIASGTSFADSLAAAGLAGALSCPILLANTNELPSATSSAISSLGATNAIILGGASAISDAVANKVKALTGSVSRLAGPTRYETQLEIYNFGARSNYWASDTAFIASGTGFADALAASPLCFALKAPIFFVDATLGFPASQLSALQAATSFKNFVVLGGTAVVSSAAENQLKTLASERGGTVMRLAGATRYETSSAIASYAVSNCGFSWSNIAFTSGDAPYDALAGAPLQGKNKSPMLLVNASNTQAAKVASGKSISTIFFFGGYNAIKLPARVSVCATLGTSFYKNVGVTSYGVSLSTMAALEEKVDKSYGGNSYATFYSQLDTSSYSYNTYKYLQFAKLNKGYSGVSAETINAFISDGCAYSESRYGRTSALRNTGQYFVNAAKQYGINEVYFLAHAIWESAWGCSDLSTGWTADVDRDVVVSGKTFKCVKDTTYYNFFGIGAYDSNALSAGRAYAVKEDWTSVEKAIMGAAKWIASNYLNRAAGNQNTLYLMKFDLIDAEKSGSVWHQYCTGGNSWVLGIASVMNSCYSAARYSIDKIPVTYDVPAYSGA